MTYSSLMIQSDIGSRKGRGPTKWGGSQELVCYFFMLQLISAAEGIVEIDYSTDFVKTVCGFCKLGLKKVLLG
jgi:hypothetical protein